MSYTNACNIEDLRQLACRRLPRVAWDYLEQGAEDDVTLKANRSGFERIHFRPRTLVDVSGRTLQHRLFGKTYTAPFGIAPTGAAGLYCFDADIALARAACAADLHVCAVHCIVCCNGAHCTRSRRQQAVSALHVQGSCRGGTPGAPCVRCRFRSAGGDHGCAGRRQPGIQPAQWVCHSFRINARNMLDGVRHPRWLIQVFLRTLLSSGVPRFQNVDRHVGGRILAKDLSAFRARRDALDWSDIDWLRTIWPRQLLVKGILTTEDAQLALEHGVDGIVVSNHGGRQLDGAVAAIDALPAIVATVGRRMPVLFDGGVRRGSDIVKALALGADFVFCGRAPLYGAVVGGMDGVTHAIDLLRAETGRVMTLIGCTSVAALDRHYLQMPGAV